ncbi:MAG TPA: ATP-binding cassette domain-containing protein [Gemmatimonadaceae bacterium]|nr:ATP-binding cassette domain-containing protein [Gemmatimonadaceae bacterium]
MIALDAVSARVGDFVLEDVTFAVPQGAYGIVIGPTGAGKTTLVEAIAGLVPITKGRLVLGDSDLTRAPPELRRLSIVYQHAYLFPHLTVRENVAYGSIGTKITVEMLERFGLGEVSGRDVRVLSGGERQLVAIARALARRPEVLLLDEPFAALDPRRRVAVRRELRTIYFERRFTVLQVTHDFHEAGLLGDIGIVLDRGRVLQVGRPEELFRKPSSPVVADFLGAENVFAGVAKPIRDESPDWTPARDPEDVEHAVAFTTGSITLYALGHVIPGTAHAVIRADEVSLSRVPSSSSLRNQFHGVVTELAPAGAITRVTLDVNGLPLVAAVTTRSVQELQLAVGAEVFAAFKATAVHLC